MAEENEEKEGRVELDGVPARVLMGVDGNDNKRILRCDEDGYLLCKVVQIDPEEIEE